MHPGFHDASNATQNLIESLWQKTFRYLLIEPWITPKWKRLPFVVAEPHFQIIQPSEQTTGAHHFSRAVILPAVLLQLNVELDIVVIDHLVPPTANDGPDRFLHRAVIVWWWRGILIEPTRVVSFNVQVRISAHIRCLDFVEQYIFSQRWGFPERTIQRWVFSKDVSRMKPRFDFLERRQMRTEQFEQRRHTDTAEPNAHLR